MIKKISNCKISSTIIFILENTIMATKVTKKVVNKAPSAAQQRAQARASWATKYNASTGKAEPTLSNWGTSTVKKPVAPVVNKPVEPVTSNTKNTSKLNDAQFSNWNKLGYEWQQDFVKKNNLDMGKLWLTYSPQTPVDTKKKKEDITEPPVEPPVNTQQQQQQQQEWVTGKPDFLSKDPKRLAEIGTNLQNDYISTPSNFSDQTTFRTKYDYNARSKEQKAVLDSFYNQKKKENSILWASPELVADMMKEGKITAQDLEFLKVSDPFKYESIMTTKKNKEEAVSNENDYMSILKMYWFTDKDENNVIDQMENQAPPPELTDTPEIASVKTELEDTYSQIKQLDLDIKNATEEVYKQFPWIPQSQLNAIINDRTNKMIDTRNSLMNKADNNEMHIQTYQNNQQLMLKEYELWQADLSNRINNFGKLYWIYQETPAWIAEKYLAENPNMDTGTPQQQEMALNNALSDYYKTYSSIIMRPQAQVLREVMALAKKKWIPVSQALQENFLTPLMAKPEYKQIQNKQLGLTGWWNKFDDNTLYNENTWQFKVKSGGWTSWPSTNRETTVEPSWVMQTVAIWNKNVKIDSVAADALAAAAAELWNSVVVGEWFRTRETYSQIIKDNLAKWNKEHPDDKITATDEEMQRQELVKRWVAIAEYSASAHTSWLAIDLYNSAWWALNAEQVAIMESYWFEQTAWAWDMWHWTYQWWAWEWGVWGITGTIPWVPISYERSVKNFVPTQLMNSELELKNLNDTIQKLYEWNVSEEDVALAFMGFNIKKKWDKVIANKLVNIGRALPEELSSGYVKTIADFINSGNINQAIQKAENTAYKTAKDMEWENFISETTVKTAVKRAREIEKLINELDGWKLGSRWNVAWTLQDLFGRFKWEKAQTIKTKVTQMIAQMVNDLAWTAYTAKEKEFLEPLIPSLWDRVANFDTKLSQLMTWPLQQLNSERSTYWMEELNEDTLMNLALRANLYRTIWADF